MKMKDPFPMKNFKNYAETSESAPRSDQMTKMMQGWVEAQSDMFFSQVVLMNKNPAWAWHLQKQAFEKLYDLRQTFPEIPDLLPFKYLKFIKAALEDYFKKNLAPNMEKSRGEDYPFF